jgi:hypothetical protein
MGATRRTARRALAAMRRRANEVRWHTATPTLGLVVAFIYTWAW